jgi:sensor histidine kinase YesM
MLPAASHPLEMIPLFRRWPVSHLRNLLYTGIWSGALGLVLGVISMAVDGGRQPVASYLAPVMLISLIIGYLVHGTSLLGNLALRHWPRRATGLPRLLYHLVLVGGCVVLGIAFGQYLVSGQNPWLYLKDSRTLQEGLVFALIFGSLMYAVRLSGERRVEREMAQARQNEQIAAAGRLLAEARLRALQAQIEPHFLYNTLANVVSLIEVQPARARHMLERFIDYLRASLAASRQERATLGAEADMIAAYLDVLGVRMGERLRYRIEVPDELRASAVAPMLLQPLVENAIAHGLEPKVEGGEVLLRARMQDGLLQLEVSDTGVGLTGTVSKKPGGGVGLSNLRDRLRTMYGSGASVQLLENQPCGMTVRLLLPLNES